MAKSFKFNRKRESITNINLIFFQFPVATLVGGFGAGAIFGLGLALPVLLIAPAMGLVVALRLSVFTILGSSMS